MNFFNKFSKILHPPESDRVTGCVDVYAASAISLVILMLFAGITFAAEMKESPQT